MANTGTQAGLDNTQSVSALGLRWAALRGMLASPLIEEEEHRSLREELLRELEAIERDFAAVPARSTVELSAKIDVVKTALRHSVSGGQEWIAGILDSVQADLRALGARGPSPRENRPTANLTRAFPARPEPPAAAPAPETEAALSPE